MAFPGIAPAPMWTITQPVLTKREVLAAVAMHAWLSDPKCKLRASHVAKYAVQQADALLKELEKPVEESP